VLLAVTAVDDDLNAARREALSACTGVESMGSAMASMPHYMAQGVNELTAQGIEDAVHGLEKVLLLGMQGMEEITVFIVNLLVSTYVCLFTFAIKSSLGTVLNATQDITDFLNTTLVSISGDIKNDASRFEDKLNSWVDKLNGVVSDIFGSGGDVPTLDLASLDELNNIKIPDSFSAALQNLENNLPNFTQAQTFIDNGIRGPFDDLRSIVNSSLTVYQFNRDVFPVPEKQTLTFCSDNPAINNFFDDLIVTVFKVRNIVVAVVAALAVLAIIPMGYREWWRYRTLRQRAHMLTTYGQEFDPVDIVQIATRPFSSTLGLRAASTFKSSRRQILVRWFFAYITSTTCLFVLALGVAGLLSALGQYVLIRAVNQATPALAAEVGQFADMVVGKLEAASMSWAVATNAAINDTNTQLNDDLFSWVLNGTTTINNTLNDFVQQMEDGIHEAFGGTPLEEPVNDVVSCLVLLKVKGVEKGLAWAHDNAHVTLPTLPNNTFSLGAANSVGPDATSGADSFLSDSSSAAGDKITDVVVQLSIKWQKRIEQEACISGGLIGIWLIVVLIGLVRTAIMLMGRSKSRAEGGDKVYTGETRRSSREKTEDL
jgi:uncharacterized membrane protein